MGKGRPHDQWRAGPCIAGARVAQGTRPSAQQLSSSARLLADDVYATSVAPARPTAARAHRRCSVLLPPRRRCLGASVLCQLKPHKALQTLSGEEAGRHADPRTVRSRQRGWSLRSNACALRY